MQYVVQETADNVFVEVPYGATIECADFSHPWQIIEMWSEQELAEIGVYKVAPAERPFNPEVTVIGSRYERVEGVVTQILEVSLPAVPTKEQLMAHLASVRYDREVGGMVSPNFGALDTDRDTRAIIAQAIQSIDLGIAQEPIRFKANGGWLSLTRPLFVAISQEIVAYVQNLFDLEEEVQGKINSGEITTKGQIEEALPDLRPAPE
jgi:hypothetical protein